jgi:hypothetical protein
MIFNQEAPESDAAGSFTVREMMNNLDRTPFPLNGMRGQQFSRKTFKAPGNFVVAFPVLAD